MGQGDIQQILENNYPKWMCVHDIKQFSDINLTSIRRALKSLEKWNEIEFKIIRLKSVRRQLTYYRINKNG